MLELLLESFERLLIEQIEICEDNITIGDYYFDNVIVPLKEIITNVITDTKLTDIDVLRAFENVGGNNQMSVLFEWYSEIKSNYMNNQNGVIKSGRELICDN